MQDTQMPDPLVALPCELWTLCIEHAIDGQLTGPLELLMVSTQWARMLLNASSLWCQICIQNGEDEMAQISAFPHLSKRRSLHVDIMTVLPTTDRLQLIAEHISRVNTISIRPGPSDNIARFPMEQWKRAVSNIMSILWKDQLPPNVADTSCFGINLRENGQSYHQIILMQYTTAISVASSHEQSGVVSANLPDTGTYFRMWEEHTASQDLHAQCVVIDSIGKLASYGQNHHAIRIAIPSFIKLIEDDSPLIRSATANGIHMFAAHVGLHDALRVIVPPLIELLGHKNYRIQMATCSVLESLSRHGEFHELLRVAIPSFVKFLRHSHEECRRDSLSVIAKLAEHNKFCDMIRVAVPWLLKLLHHSNADIGRGALSVLENLTDHSDHNKSLDMLTVFIPSLVELLHHGDTAVQKLGIIGLQNLAQRNQFHELLRVAIPSIVELLDHRDIVVRVFAFTAIQRLAIYDEFHEALSVAIPFITRLLKPGNGVQSAVASAMPEICGYRKMS